ncbi:hypothetical protein E2C01_013125 [Portunus trituberculatus]|uniref:Uncharacterized protein n=1 Tax=Portunus trituberculatus TaxID=210409 RepID=A0A5B7DFE1_PORTR|nr:hypothetical protein [Portunus trituberculatus]
MWGTGEPNSVTIACARMRYLSGDGYLLADASCDRLISRTDRSRRSSSGAILPDPVSEGDAGRQNDPSCRGYSEFMTCITRPSALPGRGAVSKYNVDFNSTASLQSRQKDYTQL